MSSKGSGRGVNRTGRSKHEGGFTRLPHFTAQSPAFRSLSGPAVKIWVELHARFRGHNNGRLSLSYQHAADLLGMSKSTVARAFRELISKGFIRLARPGHWYGRRAAEWTLTDQRFQDALPTNDWQNWRAPPETKKQNAVLARSGRGSSVPPEYGAPAAPNRSDTRHPMGATDDGAA